jgi:hypothetical protein
MSIFKPGAASITAISRQRLGSLALLALFLIVPVKFVLSQVGTSSARAPEFSAPAGPTAVHQGVDYDSDGFSPGMAEKRMKMLNNERRKSLVSDSEKLLKLATELNNEIAQTNPGSLTPDQLRKVAEIEKLAHNVRDKMTMTVTSPSTSYFPTNGPPFSQ